MKRHPASVEAITDTVLAPVDKSALAMLVGRYPRLSAVMFLFAQEERITSGDRLCSLGRQLCEARMAFLLMDVLTRLRAVDRSVRASFPMHLSREQMAEVTGMTPVHASRVWTNLVRRGVIACDGNGVVTVVDEAYLQQVSGYINRSAGLDLNWLPASCPAALAVPA